MITFDDGYADNLQAAAPILRRFGQRATVFVAGACLEGKSFFYDDLEQILLLAPRLPKTLRLTIGGAAHEWELGDWARLPKTPDASYWKWNMESPADPTPAPPLLPRNVRFAARRRARRPQPRDPALRKAAATGAEFTGREPFDDQGRDSQGGERWNA